MSEIERRSVTTVVVPSLFHIAGNDYIALAKFLNFLKLHHVRLKSVAELIDSRRDSGHEIIMRLVQGSKNTKAMGGAL